VLDSTRRLGDVLTEYANALSDYDQARFRLLVALGMPPQGLVDPRLLPQPVGCDLPAAANSSASPGVEKDAVPAGVSLPSTLPSPHKPDR
jgi:hypothetical protein